jgi:small subunit ribosomal protein S16
VYRIVVAGSQSPRDGKFIEIIGQYAPRQQGDGGLKVDEARANYWLGVGAQPSDTVRSLLRRAGVLRRRHEQRLGIERQQVAVPLPERTEEEERALQAMDSESAPQDTGAAAPAPEATGSSTAENAGA